MSQVCQSTDLRPTRTVFANQLSVALMLLLVVTVLLDRLRLDEASYARLINSPYRAVSATSFSDIPYALRTNSYLNLSTVLC